MSKLNFRTANDKNYMYTYTYMCAKYMYMYV